MRFRLLRISLPVTLLVCVSLVVLTSSAGAASVSHTSKAPTSQSKVIPVTGSAQAIPQHINTSSVAQVRSTKAGLQHPALRSRTVDVAPAMASKGVIPTHTPSRATQGGITPNVAVNSSFSGIGNTGWAPSDSTNAGGPFNVIETVNEQFSIYNRAGGVQFSTTFNSWFGASGSLFDPRVTYDFWGGRFIFLVDTGTSFLVSVAQQSNGLGNYCNYSFPTIAGFADYPSMGVDFNGVYVSFNMFNSSNSNELFKIDRSAIEACANTNFWTWSNLIDSTGAPAFTIAPAVGYTFNSQEFMVSSRPGGACSLTEWILTGLSIQAFNVGTLCYSPPSAAAQSGSAGTIETLDNRIYSANYMNGLVDVSLTGGFNWGGGNVNSVVWFFKLNTNATLAQQGGFGQPGLWYFFPAIEQDINGNAIVVYNSSGASTFVNVWYVALNAGGGVVSNNALVWGTSFYGTSGTGRWGDFQSARLDPTSSTQIWICGQYTAATNSWGTWNGDVSF